MNEQNDTSKKKTKESSKHAYFTKDKRYTVQLARQWGKFDLMCTTDLTDLLPEMVRQMELMGYRARVIDSGNVIYITGGNYAALS